MFGTKFSAAQMAVSPTLISSIVLIAVTVVLLIVLLYHWNKPAPSEKGRERYPITTKDIILWAGVFFGTLLMFRGGTNLLDEYFLPDQVVISNIVTFLVGVFVIAMIIFVTPKAVLPTHM